MNKIKTLITTILMITILSTQSTTFGMAINPTASSAARTVTDQATHAQLSIEGIKRLFATKLRTLDITETRDLLSRYPEITKPLLYGDAGKKAFEIAIKKNDVRFCMFLIESGVSILSCIYDHKNEGVINDYQSQAIQFVHIAAFFGMVEIMELFLNHLRTISVSINTVYDNQGNTILHYTWHKDAPKKNQREAIIITEKLIAQGASLDIPNKNGITARQLMQQSGIVRIAT